MAIGTFERVKPHLLKHEGGYVDHPKDPGGATNMGVTRDTLSDWRGHYVSKEDVRNLSVDEAHSIYKARYWDAVKGDQLPLGVDYATYDFAVNSGPSRAIKELQKVAGVEADGAIGPVTLDAVSKMDARSVVNRLCDRRLSFMRSIKGGSLWKTFGKGWSRRVADVRSISIDLIGNPDVDTPSYIPVPNSKPKRDKLKSLTRSKELGLGAGGVILVALEVANETSDQVKELMSKFDLDNNVLLIGIGCLFVGFIANRLWARHKGER